MLNLCKSTWAIKPDIKINVTQQLKGNGEKASKHLVPKYTNLNIHQKSLKPMSVICEKS